jgi:hypothetical protein
MEDYGIPACKRNIIPMYPPTPFHIENGIVTWLEELEVDPYAKATSQGAMIGLPFFKGILLDAYVILRRLARRQETIENGMETLAPIIDLLRVIWEPSIMEVALNRWGQRRYEVDGGGEQALSKLQDEATATYSRTEPITSMFILEINKQGWGSQYEDFDLANNRVKGLLLLPYLQHLRGV